MNPFTDLSHDSRLAVNIEGFLTKLRVPSVLHALAMEFKGDNVSLGDYVRALILKDAISTLNTRHSFREIYDLLGTVFGLHGDRWIPGAPLVAGGADKVTGGTGGDERHPGPGKARAVGDGPRSHGAR